jgi:hypothetical protein
MSEQEGGGGVELSGGSSPSPTAENFNLGWRQLVLEPEQRFQTVELRWKFVGLLLLAATLGVLLAACLHSAKMYLN